MNLNKIINTIPDKWVRLLLFYTFSFAFILLNAWLVVKKDTMLGVLIPALIVILVTAVFSYNRLIWLTVALAPLSVPLEKLYYGLPFDMHIPTEPLLFGILLLFIFSVSRGKRIDNVILKHPISRVLYLYLGWMALTSITSTMPLVSLKFLLARTWYVVIFFFLAVLLFKDQRNIVKFIWVFLIALVPVMLFTLIRHSMLGILNNKVAHWVMTPFFNDHTSYGAVLAMMIPIILGFSMSDWLKKSHKTWAWLLLIFFTAATIFSYSRAAWLSLFAASGVWVLIKLKIKFKTLIITIVSLFLVVVIFQDQILQKLEQNSTDSSSNLTEHITSMTNISIDASNLERINRWQCALAMFEEKPFLGWGPGTYAFQYAPFQLTQQRTIISTNSGDGGNAHSEYLGSMAESGVMGLITFLLIVIYVISTGINAYIRSNDKKVKTLLLSTTLSLITYYIHSFLNNFLDTDKASIPFWGFTAIIVGLDIYTKQQKITPKENQLEL